MPETEAWSVEPILVVVVEVERVLGIEREGEKKKKSNVVVVLSQ